MITVSVIIPAYNEMNTIKELLDSVKKQNIKGISFEIIVIDDASEDNSKLIWSSLSHESNEIVCIENKKNKGVGF